MRGGTHLSDMGLAISSVFSRLTGYGGGECRILMVGLDAAGLCLGSHFVGRPAYRCDLGKTTILYKLKLGEVVTTIPTIGDSALSREPVLTSVIRF